MSALLPNTVFADPAAESDAALPGEEYTVTLAESEHGSVSFRDSEETSASFPEGEEVCLCTEPEEGYLFDGITLTGTDGEIEAETSKQDDTSCSFVMPAEDVTLKADFTEDLEYDALDTPLEDPDAPGEKDGVEDAAAPQDDASKPDDGTEAEEEAAGPEEAAEPSEEVDADLLIEFEETLDIDGTQIQTDAVLESYITEHINTAYVGTVTKMEIVNGLVVKNTLMDGNAVARGDTLDIVMGGIEAADPSQFSKLLGQVESIVAVYDVNEDCDYYVASANTMMEDASVWDHQFALFDNLGHVVSGCIYDGNTGLAYIPKDLYVDESGTYLVCRIQLQLMQVIGKSLDDMNSEVLSSTAEEASEEVDVYRSVENIFCMETTAQAEPGLDPNDMLVAVNGIPTTDYDYDAATGQITVEESSAAVQTLSVLADAEESTAAARSSITTFAANETNVSVEGMQTSKKAVTIELPNWVIVGTGLSGEIPVDYSSKSLEGYGGGKNDSYAYIDMNGAGKSDVDDLYNWITSDSADSLNKEFTGFYFHDFYMLFKLKFSGTSRNITYDTEVMGSNNNYYGSVEPLGESVDFSELGDLILSCGHISAANQISKEIIDVEADAEDHLVFLKCVWMSEDKTEAVFGMVTGGTGANSVGTTQAGIGLIKLNVNVDSTGYLALTKASSNPSVTDKNSCYSLAGAEYTVYENESCTTTAKDINGNSAVLKVKEDGSTNTLEMEQGDYWVKETKTPAGYCSDTKAYPVTVGSDNTEDNPALVSVKDDPIVDTLGIRIVKTDAETGESVPQGDASLADARFTIRFYAGNYGKEELSGLTPTRTWIVGTKEEDGVFAAGLGEVYAVPGSDEWYVNDDGQAVLPLGTYTIQETSAPEGYLLIGTFLDGDGVSVEAGSLYYTQFLESSKKQGDGVWLYGGNEYTGSDSVIRGGVRVQKRDLESGRTDPQGNASFEGAVFEIINAGKNAVLVNDILYQPGETVLSLITDADGTAQTSTDALPYGTYVITETKQPDGYLLGSNVLAAATEQKFEIREDGVIVDMTGTADSITDQVKRGDLCFVKQDGENQSTDMGSVRFSLTSETTGERHEFWTDENGTYSTSSDWVPHSQNTNAGESYEDGVWFCGYAGDEADGAPVNDSLGALPYDDYILEELPCENNEGRTLVTTRVHIYRDGVLVHLGTIDNYKYGFVTSASGENGEKYLTAAEDALIVDEIEYWGLDSSETYTFVTELFDLTAVDMVKDADGNDLSLATSFSPHAGSGTEKVRLRFDAGGLEGHTLVIFETLIDNEGNVLTAEADAGDEDQTIFFTTTQEEENQKTGPLGGPAGTGGTTPVKTGDVSMAAWFVVMAASGTCLLLMAGKRMRRAKKE